MNQDTAPTNAQAPFASIPGTGVSIVIPTLNEVENIDLLLIAIFDYIRALPCEVEIIVVDDGSTDGTREKVRGWEDQEAVRLLERGNEGGLSGAVLAGGRLARHDVVVVMDADLSHPAEAVPDLVGPVLSGEKDMMIGSRYVKGGSTPGWPRRRRVLSRVASMLAWPIVDVRDPMSGFFAVRKQHLLAVDTSAKGYKIGLEVIAAAGGQLRVGEVPIAFTDRLHGTSKLGRGQVLAYLDRLRAMSGGAVSSTTARRFAVIGLLGMVIDLLCFDALLGRGLSIGAAHILSFVLASMFNFVLNARWAFKRSADQQGYQVWLRYRRFTGVALMALMMRGALLAAAIQNLGLDPRLAIMGAVALAAIVNYLGCAFFVFPSKYSERDPAVRWRVASIGVVAYLMVLRLLYLGIPDLLMEEAYYWNYAQHPSLGYLDHPPAVAWLIWLGTTLFGTNEFGVRIGAWLCWCVTASFVYLMARDLYGKAIALRAILLVAVLPFFFFVGYYITPDAPLTACWAAALYFLQRALLGEHRRAWWGVGVAVGIGMLSKYTIALLGPATLLFILSDARSRRWLLRPEPYAAVLLAVVLFLPVIAWNANNGWVNFAFQTVGRTSKDPAFSLHLLVGSALILMTPLGVLGFAMAMLRRSRASSPADTPASLVLGPNLSKSRRRCFALIFTLVPLAVFVWFSISHAPKLNWIGPLCLAAIPLLAWNMVGDTLAKPSIAIGFARKFWTGNVVGLMLIYGTFFHYIAIGLPGIPYPDQCELLGWQELGRLVEVEEDRIQAETGDEPLVVGLDKYGISSRLAFYRTHANHEEANTPGERSAEGEGVDMTVGRNLFGRSALMYEWWTPSHVATGRTVIIVDDVEEDLASENITKHFDSISPIQVMEIEHGGQVVRRSYYRIGYGYRAFSDGGPQGAERGVVSYVLSANVAEE